MNTEENYERQSLFILPLNMAVVNSRRQQSILCQCKTNKIAISKEKCQNENI
jgi:hypothetical protein